MIAFRRVLLLLVICSACGQEPSALTTSVTNGDLVLGVVPVAGGGVSGLQLQRYRLLVCKYRPEYNDGVFVDSSVCRSALLTKAGEEIDIVVGNKYEGQDGVHLPAAAEVRRLHRSPLDYYRIHRAYYARSWTYGMLSILIIPAPVTVPLTFINEHKSMEALKGNYQNDEKERRAVGDRAPRTIPSPASTTCSIHGCQPASFHHNDVITDKHWNDFLTSDFNDITSVKDKTDLRDILFSVADFLQLKVNEKALFR